MSVFIGQKRKRASESQDEELVLLGVKRSLTPIKAKVTHTNLVALPWHGSSAQREEIRMLFHAQLLWELKHSDDIFAAFLPFLSDRGAKQVSNSTPGTIPPAPRVTNNVQGAFELRSYQVEGVQFLVNNFHKGLSCILADDMGLGKTAQVSSFFHYLHSSLSVDGPHLIIAPLSTLSTWSREIGRWAPNLSVVKGQGAQDIHMLLSMPKQELRRSIVVTTYQTCLSQKAFFKCRSWSVIVVDEAHALKEESQINRLAAKLQSVYRIAVTGTPIQNHPGELWRIVKFLFPLITSLDGAVVDEEDYSTDDEDHESQDVRNDQSLEAVRILKYIMLRRTKDRLTLPPKTEAPLLLLEPTPLQTDLNSLLSAAVADARSDMLLNLFMQMRKICLHPLNIKLKEDQKMAAGVDRLKHCGISITAGDLVFGSAKMMKLDSMLPTLRAEGHRVLIFTNFTCQLDILEGFAQLKKFSYERLDGSVARADRELSIMRFNHPKSKIFLFLISTQAGGVGITLTGADTVIFYDSHFNPQMDAQAADRVHRIGQTKPVTIYRLAIRGSVEERILERAAQKAKVSKFVIDGTMGDAQSMKKYFTHDELRQLMASSKKVCEKSTDKWYNTLRDILLGDSPDVRTAPRQEVYCPPKTAKICFDCKEALGVTKFYCNSCPKAFHARCLEEGEKWNVKWACPRHSCSRCEVKGETMFCCVQCADSYCIECLDPIFTTEMTEDGLGFKRIHKTYYGMEEEQMIVKKSMYYILCEDCAGGSTTSSDCSSFEAVEEIAHSPKAPPSKPVKASALDHETISISDSSTASFDLE